MFFTKTKKIKIGFIFNQPMIKKYKIKRDVSLKIRICDIVGGFKKDKQYQVEIYRPWKKYDIIIFQKKFDTRSLFLAKKNKEKGVKIILDINVNYYDKSWLSNSNIHQHADIIEFTKICDCVITTTDYIKDYIKTLFPSMVVKQINEHMTHDFQVKKNTENLDFSKIKFVYCGYSVKAPAVLLVKNILEDLARKYKIEYLFICEEDPRINLKNIETYFIKYNYKKAHQQIIGGDIFLSPRDLNDKYNLGHSFTKIGLPMSVGVPVISSPIPSYKKSPAILIDDFGQEWADKIEKLISSKGEYRKLSEEGIDYCKNNFSISNTINNYKKLFEEVIKI